MSDLHASAEHLQALIDQIDRGDVAATSAQRAYLVGALDTLRHLEESEQS